MKNLHNLSEETLNELITSGLLEKVNALGKGEFVSFPNYKDRYGNIHNYVVNGNINYAENKRKDFDRLMALNGVDLVTVSTELNISIETVCTALMEVRKEFRDWSIKHDANKMKKELNVETLSDENLAVLVASFNLPLEDIKSIVNRTNRRSEGQTNAYINVGNGCKVHKQNRTIEIYGFVASKKEVLIVGYPTVNSSDKTKAKNKLKKLAKLKTDKFRSFKADIGSCEYINLSGGTATM
jgi:hypothetical protein